MKMVDQTTGDWHECVDRYTLPPGDQVSDTIEIGSLYMYMTENKFINTWK